MHFILTTLGCKVNQYESSGLSVKLAGLGFLPASGVESADVFIVNSCTVTGNSDRKTRRLLAAAKQKNPRVITVLTGCFPQAYPDEAKKLGADITCGTAQRAELPALIEQFVKNRIAIENISELPDVYEEFCGFNPSSARTRAFIKIQDGCDCGCAYCVVPRARGTPRSRPLADVSAEADASARAGYKEIVLTGINLTKYEHGLSRAVSAVAEFSKVRRVRLSSVEPDLLTDEMLEALALEKKLCPHFHMSLQSGSDSVLARMRRRYTADEYYQKVQKIRHLFGDNCALTTDIITGFPGETEQEFRESLDFARKVGFSKIHVFPFSTRSGTPAASMKNQVPDCIKRERRDIFLQAAEEMQSAFLSAQVGRRLSVLVEKENFGHAENYVPVKIIGDAKRNEIINAKIIKKGEQNNVSSQYLYGEKV
jgi:threonylcarbamoyladenosine tRNA methylthiotransferase MtaB